MTKRWVKYQHGHGLLLGPENAKQPVFEIHTTEMHTTPCMAPGVDPPKEQREETTLFVEESEKEPIDTHVQVIFETGSDTSL